MIFEASRTEYLIFECYSLNNAYGKVILHSNTELYIIWYSNDKVLVCIYIELFLFEKKTL